MLGGTRISVCPQHSVELIIANSTELGFKAIVDQSYWGLLYKDEVDRRLSFGQSIQGYIKHIREDGKNVSMAC